MKKHSLEREREREGGREGGTGRSADRGPVDLNQTFTQGLKIIGEKVFHLAYAACLGLLGLPQLALLRESQRTWVYSHPATPRLGQAAPHFNDYLGYDMGPLTAGSWSPLHVVRLGFRAPQ